MKIAENVLKAIGNTSIVRLNKVIPQNHAKVLVKLEWENPTGSMKDRMAQAMIAEAEKDGRLAAFQGDGQQGGRVQAEQFGLQAGLAPSFKVGDVEGIKIFGGAEIGKTLKIEL